MTIDQNDQEKTIRHISYICKAFKKVYSGDFIQIVEFIMSNMLNSNKQLSSGRLSTLNDQNPSEIDDKKTEENSETDQIIYDHFFSGENGIIMDESQIQNYIEKIRECSESSKSLKIDYKSQIKIATNAYDNQVIQNMMFLVISLFDLIGFGNLSEKMHFVINNQIIDTIQSIYIEQIIHSLLIVHPNYHMDEKESLKNFIVALKNVDPKISKASVMIFQKKMENKTLSEFCRLYLQDFLASFHLESYQDDKVQQRFSRLVEKEFQKFNIFFEDTNLKVLKDKFFKIFYLVKFNQRIFKDFLDQFNNRLV